MNDVIGCLIVTAFIGVFVYGAYNVVCNDHISAWLKSAVTLDKTLSWGRVRQWVLERVRFDIVRADNKYRLYIRFPWTFGEMISEHSDEQAAIRAAEKARMRVDRWLSSNQKPRVVWQEQSKTTTNWPGP